MAEGPAGDEDAGREGSLPGAPGHLLDPTFRNGSVTAIGVVGGFSLAFLSNWTFMPGRWGGSAFVAFILLALGIAFQLRALVGMLETQSLRRVRYNRLVKVFAIGIYLTAAGVLLALVAELPVVSRYLHF
ncbi:hypothetical protein LJE71_24880 [Xanthobacter autotrophicus]|uniref:hypothetical protein n=1 Tax=Xanthobacter TaxID=279 RepID=UPI00182B595D|nr:MULTISPECIES: hypothetical protein [Xanthobacter]NMN58568.1 hypothetical protein [Xanthobacter sp. SG618]UDQ89389.1 hypothetical protein LJE71_24880 [Xanthobacter autotrophicus]